MISLTALLAVNKHKTNNENKNKYSKSYPWYVLKDSLSDNQIHVLWKHDGLLVTEELAKRINRKKHKGIEIFKVDVLSAPTESDNFDLPLRF